MDFYFDNDPPEDDNNNGFQIDPSSLSEDEKELTGKLRYLLELLRNTDTVSIVDKFIRTGMSGYDELPPGIDLFEYIIPVFSDIDIDWLQKAEERMSEEPEEIEDDISLYRHMLMVNDDSVFYPILEVSKLIGSIVEEDGVQGFAPEIEFAFSISKEVFIWSSVSSVMLSLESENIGLDIAFSERLPDGHYIVYLSKHEYKASDDEFEMIGQLALNIDEEGNVLNEISRNVIRGPSELSLN